MLKTVIVDDEHHNREVLATLLQQFCPIVKIVAQANSVETAYKEITEQKPELVFLDIQMPTGNGFQLLEKFDPVFFDTIFVTSYDKYAINAIKFSALDYLLKPVDVKELITAVDKAIKKMEKESRDQSLYQNLLTNIQPGVTDKKMVIHVNAKAMVIQMSHVGCMEADSNYSNIYMIDGTKHCTAKTLKEIDEFIGDMPDFVRINRSIIINISYCSHYQKGEPYLVVLKNGARFEISRRKRPEVLDKLRSLPSQ